MGYYNKGVAVHDKYYNKFNSIKSVYNKANSLQTSSVTSIESDKDHNLWIGMEGGGIDVVDPKTNQFTHINSFKKSDYQVLPVIIFKRCSLIAAIIFGSAVGKKEFFY